MYLTTNRNLSDYFAKCFKRCFREKLTVAMGFPGKSTGVGGHFLLQGIFPTQGPNLGLLHCRQILYCLSQQGSPIIKHEWLLYNEKVKHLFILIY